MIKAVLTGTSYAGKTTLLNHLDSMGYATIEEAETPYVQKLKSRFGPEKTGELILGDYFRFKSTVGRRQAFLESRVQALDNGIVICDRSAIDWVAYCKMRNSEVPPIIQELADSNRYQAVFFLEMLSKFDERRSEGRVMKEEEARRLNGLVMDEYTRRGYEITVIPEFDPNPYINIRLRAEQVIKTLAAIQSSSQ